MANAELDDTISALSGGITALNPATAVSHIEGWMSQLQATGQPHLTRIAFDLGALRTLLTNGSLNGPAIGQLLTQLGQQTNAAAAGAEAGSQDRLRSLGALLVKAGSVL